MSESPELITFDIFGTVLDWKTGLETACEAAGRPIAAGEFDRIVDVQGELEQGDFLAYAEITARSLRQVLGLEREVAAQIGRNVGGCRCMQTPGLRFTHSWTWRHALQ